MQILLYDWESYLQYDIKKIFRDEGVNITPFFWKFKTKNFDEKFEKWFENKYVGIEYDALFSINYWPMLSKVAQKKGIRYIAWCYDNPLNVTDIENTLGNDVNTVVFFDMVQYMQYANMGFDTVYYLPLAVNVDRLGKTHISELERSKFSADISLVGSLYESRIQELKQLFDERTNGYLDALMAAQQNLYGFYLFDKVINDELISKINDNIHAKYPESSFCLAKEALTFAMASEVTRKERIILLTLLGRRFNTALYSFQNSIILKDVKCFPPIDYINEMPKVFSCTKINLNPVLRCIQSGIPLRALDVMGVGGFLLSSYQPELAEQFANGEEMVLYESIEDAVEKASFYIANDDLRKKIAMAGRKKVCEQYSMRERLRQIMKLANIE